MSARFISAGVEQLGNKWTTSYKKRLYRRTKHVRNMCWGLQERINHTRTLAELMHVIFFCFVVKWDVFFLSLSLLLSLLFELHSTFPRIIPVDAYFLFHFVIICICMFVKKGKNRLNGMVLYVS